MGPVTVAVTAGAAAALAAGGYLLLRRRRRRQEGAAAYHHFRCPGCRRRLRFLSRQAGHRGQCSHCGPAVTFPPASQSID
jgi:LPXTG-motif cell wall-anchored protein